MTDCSDVTSLVNYRISEIVEDRINSITHKETSCFQTGLCGDMRDEPNIAERPDFPEPADDDGVWFALPFLA